MSAGLVLQRQAGLMYHLDATQLRACTAPKACMPAGEMPWNYICCHFMSSSR